MLGWSGSQHNLPERDNMPRHRPGLDFKLSDLKKPTVIVLIISNLLPIYGVLFLGWEVFPIMLLFWTENVIIGVFNILKMLMVSPADPIMWLIKLFQVPFFSFMFAVFAVVHGIFIYTLFGGAAIEETADFEINSTILRQTIGSYNLWWGFVSLLMSHGASFVMNYIGKGEYKEAELNNLIWQPYKRVIVLHLTIFVGGILLLTLGSPTGGLIILILLKIAVDALAHLKLHKGKIPAKVSKSGFTAR